MRRFRFVSLCTLASVFCLLPALNAAEAPKSPISVKSEIDRAEVKIGDPVEYKVTIKHLPEIRILSNISAPDSDIVKVSKISDIKTETADGYVVTGKKFQVKTFRLGNFILDPVKIDYLNKDGKKESVETDKIYIRVKSVAEGEEKQDIRGVKGVVSIPQKLLKALLIGGAAIVSLLVAIAVFLLLRKPKQEVIPEPTPLEAHEEALKNLNTLFDSDLIRNDKHKQYFLLLSEILRTYLERRYKFLAVESTTHEIAQSLKNQPAVAQPLRHKIVEVLENADLAKFAKWKPQPTEILELNKKSLSIVEESKPDEKVEATNHA